LWVVDSGLTDLLGTPKKLQSPTVFVFDLNTNQLIRRFVIPTSQTKSDSFFVNIVSLKCDKSNGKQFDLEKDV
jgi:hypothetical protein